MPPVVGGERLERDAVEDAGIADDGVQSAKVSTATSTMDWPPSGLSTE